jgi:hypothetical protein
MFIVIRCLSLFKHHRVLDNMMSFPDSCGSWAEDDGCTRIVWDAKGCVRYETVDHNYNTVFNVNAFKMNE